MQSTNTLGGLLYSNTQLALQFLEKQKRAAAQITETIESLRPTDEIEKVNDELYRFTTELALQFIERVRYGNDQGGVNI